MRLRNLSLSLLFAVSTLLAQTSGYLPGRYIVELQDPGVLEASKSKARAAASSDVAARQAAMAQAVIARGATVKAAVQNVANALIVETNELGAAAILTIPGVRSVDAVQIYRTSLDRAVLRSGAPTVWNNLGGQALAGKGVKIGILDSGIQSSHPAFQGATLEVPAGFPKLTNESDRPLATGKVIVVRSYVDQPFTGRAESGLDVTGHGTMVAAAAAAVEHTSPLGSMSGMAPGAQIGSYRTQNAQGASTSDVILRALDDAATDGMDVVNMSLSPLLTPPFRTILDRTIDRLDRAGIVVVEAGGNSGPDLNTVGTLGTTESLVVAGAVENDRRFQTGIVFTNGEGIEGFNGNGTTPTSPVTGVVLDAASTGNELGCDPFPANRLTDQVVLILRGTCNFSTKINNAQQAGARAALIYTDAARPDASNFVMDVEDATLPAMMFNYVDGLQLKQRIAEQSPVALTVNFRAAPVFVSNANVVTDFSGRGPQVDFSIRPDLVAVGGNIYLPTQNNEPGGLLYSQNGYRISNGTSFASPLIAGGMALIKAARPGLTGSQYRSLLINSAVPMVQNGRPIPPQEQGAGLLNVENAVRSTIVVAPTQAALGVSQGSVDADRELIFTNIGASTDTLTFRFEASTGEAIPEVTAPTLALEANGIGAVHVRWKAEGLAPGAYQGFLIARSEATGLETRIPYWLGVTDRLPAAIVWLSDVVQVRRNTVTEFTVKVLDKAAVPTDQQTLGVTAELLDGAQEGSLVSVTPDSSVPGLYTVRVRMSSLPGVNVFRLKAGDATSLIGFQGI